MAVRLGEMTRTLTIQLDAEDYARLEDAAKEPGVLPGAFARMVIRRSLSETRGTGANRLDAALERAAALRRNLIGGHPMDAVELVRRGHDDLDRRGLP